MTYKLDFRKIVIIIAILVVLVVAVGSGALVNKFLPKTNKTKLAPTVTNQTFTTEENNVINIVQKSSLSVVTVSATAQSKQVRGLNEIPQSEDIGSGFIVDANGLIVTNKHVVADKSITYKVITSDNKEYEVTKISRDPNNDIAVLKIGTSGLTPITLGDSTNLKAGQSVIAIGTTLGEFRHTVTTGVISGLGRGIEAGDPYQGYVEQLDNIIQTDAAINPGNSGGPLINSSGEVIGINVAVAANAQNVGFAIPINVIKTALNEFNITGSFPAKPFLGVQYQMIPMQTAIMNNVPQGAYITSVVGGSAADKVGIKVGDIITKADGIALTTTNGGLAKVISGKKVGDTLKLEIWREGQTINLTPTLSEASQ